MHLAPSTIVTRRLTLNPLVVEDADTMVDVLVDERMHGFIGGRPLTLDELRARYQRLVVGRSADGTELWFNWIVRMTVDAQPVGAMQATVAAGGSSADVAGRSACRGNDVAWRQRLPARLSSGSSTTVFASFGRSFIGTTPTRHA